MNEQRYAKFYQNMKRLKAECATYYCVPRRERVDAKPLRDEKEKPQEKND